MEDFEPTSDETWRNHFVYRSSQHNAWVRVRADSELGTISHLFAKQWIPVKDDVTPDGYELDTQRLEPRQIMGVGKQLKRTLLRGILIPFEVVEEFDKV